MQVVRAKIPTLHIVIRMPMTQIATWTQRVTTVRSFFVARNLQYLRRCRLSHFSVFTWLEFFWNDTSRVTSQTYEDVSNPGNFRNPSPFGGPDIFAFTRRLVNAPPTRPVPSERAAENSGASWCAVPSLNFYGHVWTTSSLF